ncbi:MAG TPA: hypothetical protein VIL70_05125 [Chthoniobacterales bacterium]|jgi:hypothetical protein
MSKIESGTQEKALSMLIGRRLPLLFTRCSAVFPGGTELSIVQEGVPAAIPAEACYLGWQESLSLLAKLVEAEIPG